MTAWQSKKSFVEVLGQQMAYVEEDTGAPIVFLHGNPTSSFLWRDVMAELSGSGRLLAPDLIGMGDSAKLPDAGPERYTLEEHAEHLDAWFDAVVPTGPVTLVLHDWGGPLGFRWARMNAHRMRAIAYMETVLRPMRLSEWPEEIRDLFGAMRSDAGEEMILSKNIFIERILPGSILRDLTDEEMAEYRRPFVDVGEDRRPTLTWPRQIPLDDEPADSTKIVGENWAWLRQWSGPKLLVNAHPGAIMKGAVLEDARTLTNQSECTVSGSHFIQEDSGAEIGTEISKWLSTLD